MPRAYGSNAHLLLKREDTYGTAANGDYIRMPFTKCSLGSEQGLIEDAVLGYGRDPKAPLRDVIHDEGEIGIPLDPNAIGFWLTGLLGNPATTEKNDGHYEHVFRSGALSLPSYTIEVG